MGGTAGRLGWPLLTTAQQGCADGLVLSYHGRAALIEFSS